MTPHDPARSPDLSAAAPAGGTAADAPPPGRPRGHRSTRSARAWARTAALLAAWTLWGCSASPSTPADGASPNAANTDTESTDAANTDTASTDVIDTDDGAADTAHDATQEPHTELRVATYNVLCSFCVFPDYDPWDARVPFLQQQIAELDADLLGLQELFWAQDDKDEVTLLMAKHPVYATHYYVSPEGEGPLPAYPDATIYYRKARFELLGKGFYWLSPTPEVPFSSGFAKKGSLSRLVAWVHLKDLWRPGREVLFANTHVDNNSPSQELSAPLIVARTEAEAGLQANPKRDVIVVGDFNSKPDSPAFAGFTAPRPGGFRLVDTFSLVDQPKRLQAKPEPSWSPQIRIDHIFVGLPGAPTQLTAPAKPVARDWTVDLRRFGDHDRFPSDHWPVSVTLDW